MARKGLALVMTGAEVIAAVRVLEPEAGAAWRRLTADWSPGRRCELLSDRRLRYLEAQARLPIARAAHGARLYSEFDLRLIRLYVRLVAVHGVPVGDTISLLANFRAVLRHSFERPPRAGTLVVRGKFWELLPPRFPVRDAVGALAIVSLRELLVGTRQAIARIRREHPVVWTGATRVPSAAVVVMAGAR